jgi:HD-like signal output (HDOD) protein
MIVVAGQSSAVRDEILRLEQIPPLSATAAELLRVAGDPDLDAKQLAKVLERDPPIAARIVGLANSAFFGQQRPVLGVEEAIIRVLGLNLVRSLALGMALAGSLDTSRCPLFDLRHYWVVALGSATLGRDLANAVGQPSVLHPDAAYMCGLLHTLGDLALLHLQPDLLCRALQGHHDDPDSDLMALQQKHLGVDSWQAGEWLAFQWHLPEQVQHTIGFFTTRDYQGPHRALVQVVAAARAWVLASLAGDLPEVTPPDAAAAEFQRIVGRFRSRLDELQALAASLA